MVYTLTENDELRIEYTATSDQDTPINLTNHSYFNLAGSGDILGHEVQLAASQFVPIGANLIPYGDLRPVQGTPMDFSEPTPIGARIDADDEQIRHGLGYDHTWVLDKPFGTLGLAARVYEPTTGRVLEAYTTEPGVQFYSGNFLDGSLAGKGGQVYAAAQRFLPGDPALPRLAQPAAVPIDAAAARRDLPSDDDLSVWGGLMTR